MSDTGIQTTTTQPATHSETAPSEIPIAPRKRPTHPLLRILKPIASLRLTVVLFALSIVLVFFGTLAQKDLGIWTVMSGYFRSWIAWVPFQLLVQFGQIFAGVDEKMQVPGSFPFPGGWLLGGLLLINVLAAHAVRFKFNLKRSGIWLIHVGIIILMLGELITGLYAVESRMTIAVGETTDFIDVSQEVELAIVDSSDPEHDQVTVIPGSLLQKEGTITKEALPFEVVVHKFMKNSSLATPTGNAQTATIGADREGHQYTVVEKEEESGVKSEREDAAAVRVSFRKGDQEVGPLLLSLWTYPNFSRRQLFFPPRYITLDGKKYRVALRPKRIHKSYGIHLEKFEHKFYQATDTPRDFRSTVQLLDPSELEERRVKIYMNNPLRYRGETFYQSGWLPGDRGTILQVVRNPGWLMPYISCILVSLGMLIHFGLHLNGFLRRRAAS